MAQGLLEVKGDIELDQFWPLGSSDADTNKIVVKTYDNALRFRPHSGARFRRTKAFDKAVVKGKTTKVAIDDRGRITVRLQGIDAPELHYRPPAVLKRRERSDAQHERYLEWNQEYRQHLAESATVALDAVLRRAGSPVLPCVVRSYVDHPNDVFDTYGRFVGEVFVQDSGRELSVNTWLVKNGWALPAFYNSMSDSEITTLTAAADHAWSSGIGVWQTLQEAVEAFDFKLTYRGKNADIVPDAGPILVPKVFRRLATWAVNRRATMVSGSFHAYLKKQKDPCITMEDFLQQGTAAEERQLWQFVEPDGTLLFWPEELVFKDAPSNLVGPSGPVVAW